MGKQFELQVWSIITHEQWMTENDIEHLQGQRYIISELLVSVTRTFRFVPLSSESFFKLEVNLSKWPWTLQGRMTSKWLYQYNVKGTLYVLKFSLSSNFTPLCSMTGGWPHMNIEYNKTCVRSLYTLIIYPPPPVQEPKFGFVGPMTRHLLDIRLQRITNSPNDLWMSLNT